MYTDGHQLWPFAYLTKVVALEGVFFFNKEPSGMG
jgi:hypothetical protein